MGQGYQAKYLNGIPEITQGAKVSIALANGSLCINENILIPLKKIRNVENCKVHQVKWGSKSIGKIYFRYYRNRLFNIIFGLFNPIINCLSVQKLNLMSIEYFNCEGIQCKGLFLAYNRDIKKLTALINKRRECE